MYKNFKFILKALRRIQKRSSFPHPSSPLFSSSPSSPWTHLRSALVLVTSSSPASSSSSSNPHRLKSPWSRFKRKKPLTLRRWKRCFTPDGRLRKRGVYLLKKVRSRGIDPSIRSEVWPFLLGVCDLNSSKEERGATREEKRMRDYAGNAKSFRDKTEVSLPMIFLMNSLSNHRLFELTLLEQRSTIKVSTPVVIIDQDSDPDATVVEVTLGDRL
uniref:Rab-GAP TBC domain-containing protein n=1 Tax=Brassica oleracea var. oleracea TaxID=109376 RepID=A0A0D2ZU08_BRAOL